MFAYLDDSSSGLDDSVAENGTKEVRLVGAGVMGRWVEVVKVRNGRPLNCSLCLRVVVPVVVVVVGDSANPVVVSTILFRVSPDVDSVITSSALVDFVVVVAVSAALFVAFSIEVVAGSVVVVVSWVVVFICSLEVIIGSSVVVVGSVVVVVGSSVIVGFSVVVVAGSVVVVGSSVEVVVGSSAVVVVVGISVVVVVVVVLVVLVVVVEVVVVVISVVKAGAVAG